MSKIGVRGAGGSGARREPPPGRVGARIGVDPQADRERGYHVSAGGVVVVGKGETVAA